MNVVTFVVNQLEITFCIEISKEYIVYPPSATLAFASDQLQ